MTTSEPDHANYSWDWLAKRIDADLIPLAKRLVAKRAKQGYYVSMWTDGTPVTPEQGHLHELCKDFDPYYIGEEHTTKEHANFHMVSMLVDHLGTAVDDLKALAMVKGGDWDKLPDIYNLEEEHEFLEEHGFIEKKNGKYQFTSRALFEHCLLRGRYVPKEDINNRAFWIDRKQEVPDYISRREEQVRQEHKRSKN